MTNQRFEHADGWIFVSMAFYQGETGTSLRDLIATADYINHAIPSDDEIEGGINRLCRAGLVTVEEDTFHLTPAGRVLLRDTYNQRASLLQMWELLEKDLDGMDFPELDVPVFKLKRGQSKAAYKNYFDLILDRHEKPRRRKKPSGP